MLVPAIVALILLAVLARPYLSRLTFLLTLGPGTLVLAALYALALRLPGPVTRLVDWLLARTPLQLAAAGALVSIAAAFLVFQGVPHVSDEVAYQFQARAMAAGRLSQPAPAPPAAFLFTHTMIHAGRWFGIMNPGWPALLAAGYAAGAPWLINPLLGALALLVFARCFAEAGVEPRTARIAILLMACSPLLVFMNATYMSHPANLLLFGVFCWGWARVLRAPSAGPAAVCGLALAANLLVRPVDTVAVSLPFAVHGLLMLRRRPRLLPLFALMTALAAGGVLATMVYNRALTGDARLMPVTAYFVERNPAERFGLGFGADMGTTLHGAEWPGFFPADAVRVTSYRLSQFAQDLFALPLVPAAAVVLALRRRRLWDPWSLVIVAAAASLAGVYFFHFYHGVAYGSRHLYLAVPAMALLLARPGAAWLNDAAPDSARRARALLAALLAALLVVAYPLLLREYAGGYRGADGRVRAAVRREGVAHAVVFVDPGGWAWKSAFPLNAYPLEQGDVVFALDRGAANAEVMANLPGRRYYRLALAAGRVTLRELPLP